MFLAGIWNGRLNQYSPNINLFIPYPCIESKQTKLEKEHEQLANDLIFNIICYTKILSKNLLKYTILEGLGRTWIEYRNASLKALLKERLVLKKRFSGKY